MNLLHFLIPHRNNNHRSKILHNTSLFVLILLLTFVSTVSLFVHRTHPEVLGISYSISDQELLNLVNYERTKRNLAPLKLNNQLAKAAKGKADHMFLHNYWAHFAPDGTSPWDFIKGSGYNYVYAGENLAKGFTTSYDAVKAWMNSPSHRENILSPQFRDMGFAVEEGNLQGEDTILIVQMFGSLPNEDSASSIDQKAENAVAGSSTQIPSTPGGEIMPQNDKPDILNKEATIASSNPLIDYVLGSKIITYFLLSLLLIALVLDLVIVEKKKIPRIVGNNIDHIILITLFMVFLFLAKIGNII